MARSKRSRKKYDHSACEMLIAPKCDQMGLWCATHRSYIKWLSKQDQEIIKGMDVAWLDPAPDWVVDYKRSKRR